MPHSPSPTLFDRLREIGRELARALRTARKRPTFSLVATATLGIGIGASTATFSIANAVLMRPLPVHEQRKLSVLWGVDQAAGARQVPVPYGAFKGFVDVSPKTLSAVAGVDYHGAATLPVREGADGVNLRVALVTGNLFSVLGVTPLLGRNLQAQDDSIAAAPVVAISYELWQRRYGRDPSVLGRVLTIRDQPGTIVAVMPRGFGFPAQTEVWATARPFRPVAETGPPDFYVYLVGRLAPGATVEQSATELTNYLRSNLALLPSMLRRMTASAKAFDDDLLGWCEGDLVVSRRLIRPNRDLTGHCGKPSRQEPLASSNLCLPALPYDTREPLRQCSVGQLASSSRNLGELPALPEHRTDGSTRSPGALLPPRAPATGLITEISRNAHTLVKTQRVPEAILPHRTGSHWSHRRGEHWMETRATCASLRARPHSP